MAITFRGAGAAVKATTNNITLNAPASVANGDTMLALVTSKDNVAITMAGWDIVGEANNGSGLRTTLLKRIRNGSDSYVVTHTGGGYIVGSTAAWYSASAAQLDVAGTWKANGSSATVLADAITTLNAGDMCVFCGGIATKATHGTYTGSPTPTERVDDPNSTSYPSHCMAEFIISSAGTTGARQCTASAAAVNNAIIVAINTLKANLTAAVTSFALTGIAVGLRATRTLSATVASFAVTPQTVNLSRGYTMAAEVSNLVLSGVATALVATRRLAITVANVTVTAQAVALTVGRKLVASVAEFVLDGKTTALSVARRLSVEAGEYVLGGQTADLAYGRVIPADVGDFLLTPYAVTLSIHRVSGSPTKWQRRRHQRIL
jgi:hypothetical protein